MGSRPAQQVPHMDSSMANKLQHVNTLQVQQREVYKAFADNPWQCRSSRLGRSNNGSINLIEFFSCNRQQICVLIESTTLR